MPKKGKKEAPVSEKHLIKSVHVLNVPLQRRLQTLSLLLFNWPSTLLASLGLLVIFLWMGGIPRYLMILYVCYILLVDKAPSTAGRQWLQTRLKPWARNLTIWRKIRDYFPVSLVKTADLKPNKPYIFGFHPHGILSESAFINFATNASGFDELYPGVDIRPLTLKSNLLTPFHREWAMLHGCGDASRECVMGCLSRNLAVLLVLGGAAESLDARPGEYRLTLLRRKGFCRCALIAGADLVPVFSFGEVDLFDQAANPPGSRLRRCQEWVKGVIGFAPPLINGRGVFNLNFGLLPHRRPIVSVVGAPIKVDKIAEPTREDVDKLHKRYMGALVKLFEEHKAKYGATELQFTG